MTPPKETVAAVYIKRCATQLKLSRKAAYLTECARALLVSVCEKTWGQTELKKQQGKYLCDRGFVSVSHSGMYVAAALSQSPVGVDIQRHNGDKVADVAKRFFTEEEFAAFEHSQNPVDEFYLTWCKKEALWKSLENQPPTVRTVNTANVCFTAQKLVLDGEIYYIAVTGKAKLIFE